MRLAHGCGCDASIPEAIPPQCWLHTGVVRHRPPPKPRHPPPIAITSAAFQALPTQAGGLAPSPWKPRSRFDRG